MRESEIQREVRLAIDRTDELSRGEHGRHHEVISQLLEALRSTLIEIDEALGGGRAPARYLDDFARLTGRLGEMFERLGPTPRARGDELLRRLRALDRALAPVATVEAPRSVVAPPRAPGARAMYVAGALCAATALLGRTGASRGVGGALGASLAALIARPGAPPGRPSRVALLVAWSSAAITAPLLFGYGRRDGLSSALHLLAGALAGLAASRLVEASATVAEARKSAPPAARPAAPSDTFTYDEEVAQRPTHPGFGETQ